MSVVITERERGVKIDSADNTHKSHAAYFNHATMDVVVNKGSDTLAYAAVAIHGGATDQGVTNNTTAGALYPALVMPQEVDNDDQDKSTATTALVNDQLWMYAHYTVVPEAEIDAAWSRFEYLKLSATADKFSPTGVLLGAVPPIGACAFTLNTGAGAGSGRVALIDLVTQSKHNPAATTAPAVTDDAGDGYSVNSIWTNVTADVSYLCQDATVGAAVWRRFAPSGFFEISDSSPSAVASVDFQNIPATYGDGKCIFFLRPATDGAALYARINNYSGASDYGHSYSTNIVGTAAHAGSNGAAQIQMTTAAVGNAADEGVEGEITFGNYGQQIAAEDRYLHFHGVFQNDLGNGGSSFWGGGNLIGKSEALSRLTLLFSAGDITAGRARLYGLGD